MDEYEVIYPNGADAVLYPKQWKVTNETHSLARRLRFTSPPSYRTLSTKILSLWGSEAITASTLALSYVDSTGDRCVLSSDDELQAYYDELRQEGTEKDVVRMRVVLLGKGEDAPAAKDLDVEIDQRSIAESSESSKEPLHAAPVVASIPDLFTTAPPPSSTTKSVVPFGNESWAAVEQELEALEREWKAEQDEHEAAAKEIIAVDVAQTEEQQSPEVKHAEKVEEEDAPDPEEVFPDDLPAPTPPAPSLIDDLSTLLQTFATSPALHTLLSRATSGSYTPELASRLSARAQGVQAEVRRAGEGLGGIEAVLGGVVRQVMEGIKEVNEMRAQRKGGDTEEKEGDDVEDKEKKEEGNEQSEEEGAEAILASLPPGFIPQSASGVTSLSALLDAASPIAAPITPPAPAATPSTTAPSATETPALPSSFPTRRSVPNSFYSYTTGSTPHVEADGVPQVPRRSPRAAPPPAPRPPAAGRIPTCPARAGPSSVLPSRDLPPTAPSPRRYQAPMGPPPLFQGFPSSTVAASAPRRSNSTSSSASAPFPSHYHSHGHGYGHAQSNWPSLWSGMPGAFPSQHSGVTPPRNATRTTGSWNRRSQSERDVVPANVARHLLEMGFTEQQFGALLQEEVEAGVGADDEEKLMLAMVIKLC